MVRLPLHTDSSLLGHVLNAGAMILEAVDALDKPFDDQLARGEGTFLAVSFDPIDDRQVQIGAAETVQLTLGQTGDVMLDIIWPGEAAEQQTLLDEYNIDFTNDDQIYLAFTAQGRAAVGGNARLPSGALPSSLEAEADGTVVYTHLKSFQRRDSAGEILRDLVESIKLPYGISEVEEIPAEGEVIAFQYGGYLTMRLDTTWGYSIQKYRDTSLENLQLDQRIDIASSVRLSSSLKIAGSHQLEVRRGRAPGWIRIAVRKHGQEQFNAAADIDVHADLETTGMPEDADQFLLSLLNLQTSDVIDDVKEVIGGGVDAVAERLEEEGQDLMDRMLTRLFTVWFDGESSDDNLELYFKRLQQVTDAYQTVRNIDERALTVLETYARDEKKLRRLIETVRSLPDRARLEELTDSEVWDFLQQYLGDRFYAFLTSDQTFETVQDRLSEWAQSEWEGLLTFIEVRQESFDLHRLFAELDELIQEIDASQQPEDVLAHAQSYLLQLARRLLGKQLDELSDTERQEAVEELKRLLERMSTFKSDLYARFVEALNRSHTLDLSASYSRAAENEVLIDVEINLEQAPDLVRTALYGDFSALTRIDDPSRVKLHPALFTNRLRATSQLKVDVLGLRYEWMRKIIFDTKEIVRPQGDGLIHIYEMEAVEEVHRRRQDEEVRMRFMFGLLAEGHHPQLIDTVSRLSSSYTFDITDPRTSDRELRAYLRLARYLKLLPNDDLDPLLQTFRHELGLRPDDHWGEVQVNYHVRYDPEVLLNIFRLLPEASLNGITREAFRKLTAANYRNFGGSQYEAIARLIQEREMYLTWKTAREKLHLNVDRTFCYELDEPSEPVCIDRFRRKVLDILYHVEDDLVDTLINLDDVLDRAWSAGTKPDKKMLEDAFRTFTEQRRTLEKWTTVRRQDRYVNPLFAILDKHISVVSNGKGSRSVLEVIFRPADDAVVRKVFVG